MMLRCRRTLMRKWADAPSCCSHIVCRITKGTFSSIGGSVFCRKVRYVFPFRCCGSRTGPSRRSPIIPAHTLMLNRCWWDTSTIPRGLSVAYRWRLSRLMMPSRPNVASSVKRAEDRTPIMVKIIQVNDAIATKCRFIGEKGRRQNCHNGENYPC